MPRWLLSISHLPPLLLTLESEASSSHQRTEKPQSPSNHFRVVLTLRLPNPNRHLKNNYLSWISGIIWPFWTTTQFACHFLSWHLLSLCSCVKIAWARMKREGISTLHHAASRDAPGQLVTIPLGNKAKTIRIITLPITNHPNFKNVLVFILNQKSHFSPFPGFVKISFHKNECFVMLKQILTLKIILTCPHQNDSHCSFDTMPSWNRKAEMNESAMNRLIIQLTWPETIHRKKACKEWEVTALASSRQWLDSSRNTICHLSFQMSSEIPTFKICEWTRTSPGGLEKAVFPKCVKSFTMILKIQKEGKWKRKYFLNIFYVLSTLYKTVSSLIWPLKGSFHAFCGNQGSKIWGSFAQRYQLGLLTHLSHSDSVLQYPTAPGTAKAADPKLNSRSIYSTF